MTLSLSDFLSCVRNAPEMVSFDDSMAVIDANYHFTPAAFKNGAINNTAGQNSGSCKILAFGALNGLTRAQTLTCFGDFYRKDVLENPDGSDHGNIRNFMAFGYAGIKFDAPPLTAKR